MKMNVKIICDGMVEPSLLEFVANKWYNIKVIGYTVGATLAVARKEFYR